MKKKTDKHAGFTLIELLVVIAIIGLLSALLFGVLKASLGAAKKARALSQISDLDGAVKRYFAEYGKMPVPAGQNGLDDQLVTGSELGEVVGILIDSDQRTSLDQNPKKIIFLDLDPSSFDVKTIDDMKVQLALNGYPDPWGESYGILMDLNFDDKITGITTPAIGDLRMKSAVYSTGEDMNPAVPVYKTW